MLNVILFPIAMLGVCIAAGGVMGLLVAVIALAVMAVCAFVALVGLTVAALGAARGLRAFIVSFLPLWSRPAESKTHGARAAANTGAGSNAPDHLAQAETCPAASHGSQPTRAMAGRQAPAPRGYLGMDVVG